MARSDTRSTALSAREDEVLRWIAEGKTNPEIALILGIASGTVRKHTENIYRKLGVGNRVSAARLIRRHQLP